MRMQITHGYLWISTEVNAALTLQNTPAHRASDISEHELNFAKGLVQLVAAWSSVHGHAWIVRTAGTHCAKRLLDSGYRCYVMCG